jgi:mono/diheme cytochrome c family protein
MRTLRFALLVMIAAAAAWTQSRPAATVSVGADQVRIDRGRYIVESVAMCEQCHTQRDEHGNPDRAHWLMGGPVNYRPSYSDPAWAQREPRIAGSPPGTDDEIIRLLTTGISRTGKPPAPPMPPFRLTREDAEAVLAYLKSL